MDRDDPVPGPVTRRVRVVARSTNAEVGPRVAVPGARLWTTGPHRWTDGLGSWLPLPAANVREHSLAWIWRDSPMFSAYRGTDWMQDPCRSCARREVDLGGCRCQAFALTGDATRTDPVCHLAPDHGIVEAAVAEANEESRPVELPLVARPHA